MLCAITVDILHRDILHLDVGARPNLLENPAPHKYLHLLLISRRHLCSLCVCLRKVLLEIYRKYRDTWLVALLFDDLLKWNDWFVAYRTLGPLGLVSLGSDTIDGFTDYSPGTMQGARFESGLDNSPMYDGTFFNDSVRSSGAFAVGQMELYDVGFASMFVQEAECLAILAKLLNRTRDAVKLGERAAAQRQLIRAHLWDDELHIYANKWCARRSPVAELT